MKEKQEKSYCCQLPARYRAAVDKCLKASECTGSNNTKPAHIRHLFSYVYVVYVLLCLYLCYLPGFRRCRSPRGQKKKTNAV